MLAQWNFMGKKITDVIEWFSKFFRLVTVLTVKLHIFIAIELKKTPNNSADQINNESRNKRWKKNDNNKIERGRKEECKKFPIR